MPPRHKNQRGKCAMSKRIIILSILITVLLTVSSFAEAASCSTPGSLVWNVTSERYDALLQTALDNLTEAPQQELRLQTFGVNEEVNMSKAVAVFLKGGYYCDYQDNTPGGVFGIKTLTITGGTLIVENIEINAGVEPYEPPATISLTTSETAIAPGAQFNLQWTISGNTTGLGLQIYARQPGNYYTTSNGIVNNPGAPPPTGDLLYLQPDGTWASTPALYLNQVDIGTAGLTLPSPDEGMWVIGALLVDQTGNMTNSFDAKNLLVSAGPAMSLQLNRPIANTTDKVRAKLVTSAGSPTKDIIIAAWLVLPDQSQVSLPDLTSGLQFLYSGPSTNATYTLIDQHMGPLGTGDYRLKVRMLDSATGNILQLAEASFNVCDAPGGTVSGTVYASNGLPLGGNSPTLANVKAFDIDDVGVTATAVIGANGAYTLNLPPGRFLLMADVMDSAGWHKATATGLSVIGCTGPAITTDLTAAPPEVVPMQGAAGTLRPAGIASREISPAADPPPDPNAPGGCPKPRVVLVATGNTPYARRTLIEYVKSRIDEDIPNSLLLSTKSDIEMGLGVLTGQQLMGTDDADQVIDRNVGQMVGSRFLIQLEGRSISTTLKMFKLALIDTTNEDSIRRVDSSAGPELTPEMIDEILTQMEYFSGDPRGTPKLLDLLLYVLGAPCTPYLTLDLTPSPPEVRPGDSITAKATLYEKDASGAVQPNRTIKLTHKKPDGSVSVTNGQTDSSGVYQAQFNVGSSAGGGTVTAEYMKESNMSMAEKVRSYRVKPNGGVLMLQSPHVEVLPGATESVGLTLRSNGTPVSGATVQVASSGGTLDTAQVTTDANGTATFTFTAGPQSVLANITADTSPAPIPQATASLPLMVESPVIIMAFAEQPSIYNNVSTHVTAEVFVEGARVAGLPVQFSLLGEGALSTASGLTDVNSRAEVDYTAPDTGSGSGDITATVTVDGQEYSGTTTVSYEPAPCQTVMWQGDEWQKFGSQSIMDWDQAIAYCEALECGHSDWTLPTMEQLQGLIVCTNGTQVSFGYIEGEFPHWCGYNFAAPFDVPTIDPVFSITVPVPYSYWSSTTHAYSPGLAWGVNFDGGWVSTFSKIFYPIVYHGGYARCVRNVQ
ncbi:MAG: hypothetical protein C0402_03385 [Thermodesulfovibrio sp.]|nr:hypothetical protein [Thermodesulfovibrio sp.]